jgi:hypothetical protein
MEATFAPMLKPHGEPSYAHAPKIKSKDQSVCRHARLLEARKIVMGHFDEIGRGNG